MEEILPIIPLEPTAGAMTQDRTETDGVESGSVLLERPIKSNILIMIKCDYQTANDDRRNRSEAACCEQNDAADMLNIPI